MWQKIITALGTVFIDKLIALIMSGGNALLNYSKKSLKKFKRIKKTKKQAKDHKDAKTKEESRTTYNSLP